MFTSEYARNTSMCNLDNEVKSQLELIFKEILIKANKGKFSATIYFPIYEQTIEILEHKGYRVIENKCECGYIAKISW